MKVRESKILILGANGFLGSMLSYELKASHTVFCQMRTSPVNYKLYEGANLIISDLTNLDSNHFIQSNSFDLVINLISCDHTTSENNLVYSQNVKLGSIVTIFDLYQKSKISFRKFINFSTIHVYGVLDKSLNEKSKTKPKNNYAINHLLGEKLTHYLAEKNKITAYSLRLSNSFGYSHNQQSLSWQLVVNDLCRQAVLSSSMVIKSDGLVTRDFIYYKNIINALEVLLSCKDSTNYHEILNLSSAQSVTILEVAMLIQKIENEYFSNNVSIYLCGKNKFNGPSEKQQKIINEMKNSYTVENRKFNQKGYQESYNLKQGLQNFLHEIRSR